MTGTMLFALLGVLLTGGLLIMLGVLGRRVNRHPVCRACRFDLQGLWPAIPTCPECGSGLMRARAVRTGLRRRRWLCLTAGLLLATGPLVTLVTAGLALMAGHDLARHKPASLLTWEARHGAPVHSRDSATHLLERLKKDVLTPDDVRGAVETALLIQADPARTWSAEWGEFVELARLNELVSDEQHQRFKRQTSVLKFEARDQIRVGRSLPAMVELREARVGLKGGYMTQVIVRSITMDGRPTQLDTTSANMNLGAFVGDNVLPANIVAWFGLLPHAPPYVPDGNPKSVFFIKTPSDLSIGRHVAEIEFELSVEDFDSMASRGLLAALAGGSKAAAKQPPADVFRIKRLLTFHVLPEATPAIELVSDDSALQQELERLMTPQIQYYRGGGISGSFVSLAFETESVPIGVAFDIIWRDGEKERVLGSVSSGADFNVRTLWPDGFYYSGFRWGGSDLRSVALDLSRSASGKKVKGDVILRPNVALMEKSVDLVKGFNAEIVYKDVEVEN